MKHYRFGSSTAKRTDNCSAWRVLSDGLPPRAVGAAAEFGTGVHDKLEHIALGNVTLEDVLKASDTATGEMVKAMWDATQEVFDKYDVKDYEPEVTGVYAEDCGGTLDMIAFGTRCVLLDYKTGKGHQVAAENNSQILFAAWACMENSSMSKELRAQTEFTGVILQPSLDGEIRVKEWDFTREDVERFGAHHKLAVARAREGGEPSPGEWCAFCPAATVCPAKTDAVRRAMMMDPNQLSTLAEQLALTETVLEWVSAVKERAEEQMNLGASLPGFKLVQKRATEKWRNETDLAKQHPELLTKLATPAQARKLGFDTDGYTIKESSGTTIAKDTDKREAVLNTDALKASLNAAR